MTTRTPPGRAQTGTSSLHEFELIRSLRRAFGTVEAPVLRGIGEDAAVITVSTNEAWLVTADLLAEGVHFDLATTSFNDLGYRAAAANLSDIAAMGGRPRFLLVSIALPPGLNTDDVRGLYKGLMRACAPHRVQLIGGDTSSSKGGLFLNLVVIGSADPMHILRRDRARAGDLLYVTGTLGDSRAGLELLQRRAKRQNRRETHAERFLIRRHLRPTARVKEGLLLAGHRLAMAAIDVSDGLSGDLRHLCEESEVGAEVETAALPISPACRAYSVHRKCEAADFALAGGEDYELLFTVPSAKRAHLERLARTNRVHMTCIGKVTSKRAGLTMKLPNGRRRPLPITSYEHFHRSM